VRVKLPAAVQLVVYYSSALARPGDGALLFSEDLYGLDAKLEAAWARGVERTVRSRPLDAHQAKRADARPDCDLRLEGATQWPAG